VTCGGRWRLIFAHGFDDVFDFRFERVDLRLMRIGYQAADDGDALDQLGNRLGKQQCESERDERFGGPLGQAAGVGRLLIDGKRPVEEGDTGYNHNDRQRQQKKSVAGNLDRVAQPAWQLVVYDVDADVFVVAQRPGCAQQKHQAEQHPLQLEPGVRGHVERLADNRIDRRYANGKQDRPRTPAADLHVDGVNRPAQAK